MKLSNKQALDFDGTYSFSASCYYYGTSVMISKSLNLIHIDKSIHTEFIFILFYDNGLYCISYLKKVKLDDGIWVKGYQRFNVKLGENDQKRCVGSLRALNPRRN